MKDLFSIFFILPWLTSFCQSDSIPRTNAFYFDMGYGMAQWTGQGIDNGTHSSLTGGMGYRAKLNTHLSVSVGINFYSVFKYKTNDSIVLSDNSPVDPSDIYYAVSSRTNLVQMPVKLTYDVLQKDKIRLGVSLSWCFLNRIQHDVLLTEVTSARNDSTVQAYWTYGNMNSGSLRNIGLEIPFAYSFSPSWELLATPYFFTTHPRDDHYGSFLAYGVRVGLAYRFKKLKGISNPSPERKK